MKQLLRIALILAVAGITQPAFSDCITTVASASTVSYTDPHLLTLDISGVPAQMGAGTANQKASQLLLFDDGTPCMPAGKTITIVFNAPLQNRIDASTITIFDTNLGNGLLVNPTVTTGFASGLQTTIVTFAVLRGGTAGNPVATPNGSGIILHDLLFDVTNLPANTAVTANVTSNGPPVLTPQPITIGMTVAAGPVDVLPASLDFGSQIVGTTGSPKKITLTNEGTLPVIVSSITAPSGFIQSNTCGSSIAVDGSCAISVSFSPTSASQYSGQLTVVDNTSGSPHQVSLSGAGIPSPGAPVITALAPTSGYAGGPDFTLTITGSNFAQGSTVYWNNSPRATTYLNATTLTAAIAAADLVTQGTANVTVLNVTSASNVLPFAIVASPAPTLPFTYSIPHIVQGGGFVTKMTFVNPNIFSVNMSLTYLSETGQLISTSNYTIAAAGTLRLSTPESARFGQGTQQWAMVGATSALLVNTFFELADSTGKVLNTVGFNSADALTDFSAPVEFEPAPAGATVGRTVGMAFANPNDTSATLTLTVQDKTGFSLVNYSFTLGAFAHTAFDFSQVPQIASHIPTVNTVGTVTVRSSLPVTAIALVDELGQFAATPVVPGRSNLSVDQITAVCPTAAEVARFNLDLHLTFEFDPTAGTLVCRAAEGSANLTRLQLKAYQALRVMKNIAYDSPLPFTTLNLYDWFKRSVATIRFRGDISSSFCCDVPRSINVAVSQTSAFVQADNWLGLSATSTDVGLDTLTAALVPLARISEGFAHSCGANQDNTASEMGPWAVAMDFEEFNALHSGTFFDDTTGLDFLGRYRDVAAANGKQYVTAGNFCHNTLFQVQPASAADFGVAGLGDLPVRRGFVMSAGTATPVVASGSASVSSSDYSIVSDTCAGTFQPPSCMVTVAFAPTTIGSSGTTLTLATAPQTNISLSGSGVAQAPIPVAPYTYVIPHVPSGSGFVSKITVNNLVSIPNDFLIRYVSQVGTILSTTTYQLQPGSAVRINSIDPAARFTTSPTVWAVVASRYPVNVNMFYELADNQGRVLNTVGFNAAPALNNFVFPAEFEPRPDGSFGRTVGLALSNPTAGSVSYTMLLVNSSGATIANTSGSIGPYSQVPTDLSTIAAFKSALPNGNFVGSIRVVTNGQLSVVALQSDLGLFSATPPVTLAQ